MKAVHIFHHNDLDGRASGAVMYEYFLKYRDDVKKYVFHELDYTMKLNQKVYPDDVIVFVDYSFSKLGNIDYLIDLLNKNHEVIWIDHHGSSQNLISKIINGEYNTSILNFDWKITNDYCATWLSYIWCLEQIHGVYDEYNDIVPNIIKYVNSHDLWLYNMNETKKFIYGIDGLDYTAKNFFRKVFKNKKSNIFSLTKADILEENKFINKMITNGNNILEYVDHRNLIERNSRGFEFLIIDINDDRYYKGYALNIHGNSLVFGNKVDEYDIVCPFVKMANGQWKYSFYTTKDDVNCSELCSIFGKFDNLGGGGHRKAAGFQSKNCIFDYGNIILFKRRLLFKNNYRFTFVNDDVEYYSNYLQ